MEPKFQVSTSKIQKVSKEKLPKCQMTRKAWLLYSPIRKPASFLIRPCHGVVAIPASSRNDTQQSTATRLEANHYFGNWFPYW
jgi:hypothetical protein